MPQVVVGDKTAAAWAALLNETPKGNGRPSGEGWKTIYEFAEEIQRNPQTAAVKLKQWESEGKVESAWGRLNRQNQRFYRPVLPGSRRR